MSETKKNQAKNYEGLKFMFSGEIPFEHITTKRFDVETNELTTLFVSNDGYCRKMVETENTSNETEDHLLSFKEYRMIEYEILKTINPYSDLLSAYSTTVENLKKEISGLNERLIKLESKKRGFF